MTVRRIIAWALACTLALLAATAHSQTPQIKATVLFYKPPAPSVGGAPTTLNPSDKAAAVALSGGNLVMTNTGAGMARSVSSYSTGKFYLELTPSVTVNSFDHAVGIATASASLTAFPGNPDANSLSWAQGSTGMDIAGGAGTGPGVKYETFAADVACMAVDLGAKLIWFRVNGGDWNNNPANNPTTGTGGISISAMPAGPYFAYGYSATNTGVNTMNFGPSFAFTPPSGFGSW